MRLSFTSTQRAPKKLYRVTVVQGHLRSSKLVPSESPSATSYYSSIVTICPSFVVFIGRKSAFFCRFYAPCLVWSPGKRVFAGTWGIKVSHKNLESMGYSSVNSHDPVSMFSPGTGLWRTDAQIAALPIMRTSLFVNVRTSSLINSVHQIIIYVVWYIADNDWREFWINFSLPLCIIFV